MAEDEATADPAASINDITKDFGTFGGSISDRIMAPNELIIDDNTAGSTPAGGEPDTGSVGVGIARLGFKIGLPVVDIACAALATIEA